MTNRVLLILTCAATALASSLAAHARSTDRAAAQSPPSWSSPSLVDETVTAPNGEITTRTALSANELWGLTESKVAEKVTEGVYALRGWGIASSYALEAPGGWIIVDTGDSTRAAAAMRELLERTLGRMIRVAAILLTHWHYADGTSAWLDAGTEIRGHEFLDRNRAASTGVSVKSGFYQTRATAQFGVFHPTEGPDAFPNLMRFAPEKLLAESSYLPPTRLFENGLVLDVVVAGEPVQVTPNRTDTSCSVAFYFPRHRLVMTNMMVTGAIFNIYTLRGGPFRNPETFINDPRWVESKNPKDVPARTFSCTSSSTALKTGLARRTRRMSSDCTRGMPAFNNVASSWLNTRNSCRAILLVRRPSENPCRPARARRDRTCSPFSSSSRRSAASLWAT